MIWDAIKRLWITNVAEPISPKVAPEPDLSRIKMYSMDEIKDFLQAGKKVHVSLIREGCKICNIPFVGGGKVFVSRMPTVEEEHVLLKKSLASQLAKNCDYIIAYSKIIDFNKAPHPDYSNYSVIAIKGTDLLDLKKACKIQKLKAFL